MMSGACSTNWGEEMCIQGFGRGNLMEKGHLVEPGIDGRIIFKKIFKTWDVVMDCIDLAQDRDR